VLDEHVLSVAIGEGAVAERGVRIGGVQLAEGAAQTVSWQDAAGHTHQTTARWVVDASGIAAILARQEGWLVANREHPTATCWSRWRGVRSLDGRELAGKYPAWANRVKGLRSTATNHLTGRGWWAWIIPLKGGDVSVGVVYDQRLVELPPGPNLGERLRTMLSTHPVGRELLAEATWTEGDVHFRRHLAYSSTKYATDGAVTVGDAAAFMDPFYSPGMDWVAFTTSAAVNLIHESFRGRPVAPRVARHNENFTRCYARWFRALYLNKYYYMGDYDLMTLAFRLDLGLYYLGVVTLPFRHGHHVLETPPFVHARTEWAYRMMACYNRRFAAIAGSRHRRGVFGRHNDRRFFGFTSYEFNRRLPVRLAGLLCLWFGLELREGWRTWWSRTPAPEALPSGLGAAPLPSQS
jgi:flavin-dependent dehydrogenase